MATRGSQMADGVWDGVNSDIVSTTYFPVNRLMATNCNAPAHAKICLNASSSYLNCFERFKGINWSEFSFLLINIIFKALETLCLFQNYSSCICWYDSSNFSKKEGRCYLLSFLNTEFSLRYITSSFLGPENFHSG